jgi:CheY-like chemotaxis protein
MTGLQRVPAGSLHAAAIVLVSSDFDPSKSRVRAVQSSVTPVRRTDAPRKVLLVEDNTDGVQTMVTLLHEIGHKVVFALNGKDALDLARRMQPDFILLDLGLPGMDGFEVCKRIKADPMLKAARVIAITAYGGEEYRARSKAVGCEMHLVKPVSSSVLEELLG